MKFLRKELSVSCVGHGRIVRSNNITDAFSSSPTFPSSSSVFWWILLRQCLLVAACRVLVRVTILLKIRWAKRRKKEARGKDEQHQECDIKFNHLFIIPATAALVVATVIIHALGPDSHLCGAIKIQLYFGWAIGRQSSADECTVFTWRALLNYLIGPLLSHPI